MQKSEYYSGLGDSGKERKDQVQQLLSQQQLHQSQVHKPHCQNQAAIEAKFTYENPSLVRSGSKYDNFKASIRG